MNTAALLRDLRRVPLSKTRFWLESRLSLLACGQSRCVFALDRNRVIKAAYNDHGVRQNKQERLISRDKIARTLVAAVRESDASGHYVVAQRLGFVTEEQIESALRFSLNTLVEIVDPLTESIMDDDGASEAVLLSRMHEKAKQLDDVEALSSPVLPVLAMMTAKYRFNPFDLASRWQWGSTARGYLRIADYGAT